MEPRGLLVLAAGYWGLLGLLATLPGTAGAQGWAEWTLGAFYSTTKPPLQVRQPAFVS